MNLATVLMCWNIPRISEDHLYELFCNAGPIEEISFAKNGQSCFVVYEHADAVVTAKEIFKDVKLNGRPLRMIDHDEISKIYSQQEEQIAQNRNYNYEHDPSQNFNSNSYEAKYHLQDNQIYSGFHGNAPDYRRGQRYSDVNRRNQPYGNVTQFNQPDVDNDHPDWRANAMRNASMTCYSGNESAQSRPDLLPTMSRSSKARNPNTHSIHDVMNSANTLINNFLNPYNTPISRSSQEVQNFMNPYNVPVPRSSQNVQDHSSKRSSQLDYHGYNADSPARSMDTHEEYHHNARHKQRNKYDSNRSGHYRDHPYRDHQPDRESYARGPKFTNSSPGTNYESRRPYPRERDYKHREQHERGPRRY